MISISESHYERQCQMNTPIKDSEETSSLQQNLPALREITMVRILQQVSQVYQREVQVCVFKSSIKWHGKQIK